MNSPLRISTGETAMTTALLFFFVVSRLDYLAPYWPFIVREYWPQLLLYGGLFIATLAFGYAVPVRVLGLADLGQKVDLVERSIRCGQGDPELGAALRRDEEVSLTE